MTGARLSTRKLPDISVIPASSVFQSWKRFVQEIMRSFITSIDTTPRITASGAIYPR